jgi:hypothetical protein
VLKALLSLITHHLSLSSYEPRDKVAQAAEERKAEDENQNPDGLTLE